jgi:putative CocE/NonD family hydrolase
VSKVAAYDSYLSDPNSPVPYRPRPITLRQGWSTWLVEDQRFVTDVDVRTYATDPLTEPVVISGQVDAHLFAATSGTDSDWIVKLIDVYPEKYSDETMRGFQLMIAGDVIRGRYHKGIERPSALVPNVPVEYVIPFPANDHAFVAGHRIMVQVQSTWFPVIDRNPQKFVSNIFLAQPDDFIPATQRIFRSGAQASHLVLPVAAAPTYASAPVAAACATRTLSIRRPSMSTTSNFMPLHSKMSAVFGTRPRRAITNPPMV